MFRIAPAGPASAYKTYKVGAPASHYRPATCAEVDCDDYLNGWTMIVELGDAKVLHAVRTSGRPFAETIGPTAVTFDFAPGYACRTPSDHRILERPEIYVVRGGDWRGNPSGFRRVHTRPDYWVEDFGEHQSRLVEIARRG
jgi:hypothetical protein